jgi:hypothetical protein
MVSEQNKVENCPQAENISSMIISIRRKNHLRGEVSRSS